MPSVHGHDVRGVDVGPETRCRHYGSDVDVIAIRFPCCGTFYPCFDCHEAVADHEAERWGADDVDESRRLSSANRNAPRSDDVDENRRLSSANRNSESFGDADAPAVLCGVCGSVLTVEEYVDCEDRCPDCDAAFNPGCRNHYHLYFDDALFGEERTEAGT